MAEGGGHLGGRGWPRSGLIGLVALAALVTGGCQYLLGFDPSDPSFTDPKPLASYASGRATITIGSDPAIVLDELTRPGTFDAVYGGEASFHNAAGWYVRISGASTTSGFMGPGGFLQLDRIIDGQHWTIWDPTRCIVTVQSVDEKALRGTASCKGLRWSDALGFGIGSLEPTYIEGEDPFDAEITFEATPTSTRVS